MALGQIRIRKLELPESRSGESRRAVWWSTFGYLAVFLPLLFMIATAWMRPDWNRPEIPDWKPVLALAEASWEKADLYQARHFYVKAARIASWREDWEGLLEVACGINRVDTQRGTYSATHTLLVRAMIAAEIRQSRPGIAAVAKAFTATGEPRAASMVLARVQASWPEETRAANTNDTAACWKSQGNVPGALG